MVNNFVRDAFMISGGTFCTSFLYLLCYTFLPCELVLSKYSLSFKVFLCVCVVMCWNMCLKQVKEASYLGCQNEARVSTALLE